MTEFMDSFVISGWFCFGCCWSRDCCVFSWRVCFDFVLVQRNLRFWFVLGLVIRYPYYFWGFYMGLDIHIFLDVLDFPKSCWL